MNGTITILVQLRFRTFTFSAWNFVTGGFEYAHRFRGHRLPVFLLTCIFYGRGCPTSGGCACLQRSCDRSRRFRRPQLGLQLVVYVPQSRNSCTCYMLFEVDFVVVDWLIGPGSFLLCRGSCWCGVWTLRELVWLCGVFVSEWVGREGCFFDVIVMDLPQRCAAVGSCQCAAARRGRTPRENIRVSYIIEYHTTLLCSFYAGERLWFGRMKETFRVWGDVIFVL